MGDRGVSAMGLLGEPVGAAQNNDYAQQNEKKVLNQRDQNQDDDGKQDAPAGSGKITIPEIIERELRNDPNVLNLSRQKLQNLGDVQKMPNLQDLQKIDISRNNLDNIDALNELQRLKVIIASDNCIRAVNLQLPKLQELDLKKNFLQTVPILSQMPQLKVLILNSNNIVELKLQCKQSNYVNIMKMVFSKNKIRFTKMEVINFVKKLKDFKALRNLDLEQNPFEKDRSVKEKIIRGLPQNLEMYNNQKKIYAQGSIAQAQDQDDDEDELAPIDDDEETGGQDGQQIVTTTQVMPTLENLLYNLEAANSHPNKALKFLEQLYNDAEKIKQFQKTQNQSVFVQSFTKAKDTHTIKENIETFMQHCQLLVDNHFELRKIILSILSKLTWIGSHDFGVKCFFTLRDLMVAGKDLETLVMEQLNENVIKEISDFSSKDIPVSILIGLKDLVSKQQSNQTSLMSQLFENFFPKWLSEIKQKLSRTKGNARDDESDAADAIFALLTASLRDDEVNVCKMFALGLHDTVAEIFIQTATNTSRYLHLLEALNEISKMHSTAASQFIEKFVHRDVLAAIKITYYQYKKSQELAPTENKDNIALIVSMYRVFSAQIELIGSLLNAEEAQRNVILADPLVSDLLQVLTHNNTDPILLTSLCYLAVQMLNCDLVRTNPVEMADKINKLQSCENLLGYLGGNKLNDLKKNVMKYNNQEDTAAVDNNESSSMEYLNDPILFKLFISIIRLLEFFLKELEFYEREQRRPGADLTPSQAKIMKMCDNVSARLNENDREEALFKVLEIPDDDVRLAVVNCLYYVPIDEIDSAEIDQLLKLMSPQNIGAGKTELVLSVIFNILSNLISDTQKKNAVVTDLFKTKFSFTAISQALVILQKNQERHIGDPEEEKEKYTLSLAILNFLKFASKESKTKDQIKKKPEILKAIMYAEQSYTCSYENSITPIEVETTQLGMDFESLMKTMSQGFEQVEPYNWVSFRILHQMANLLQNQYPQGTYDAFTTGDGDTAAITKSYKQQLQNKKTYEYRFWEAQAGNEIEDQTEDEKKDFKMHHKNFTKKNGVKAILNFLTLQSNQVEQWLRQNGDPAIDHAGEQDKHPIFGRGLKYKIRKKFRKANLLIETYRPDDNNYQQTSKGAKDARKPKGKSAAQAAAAEPKEKHQENNDQAMRTLMKQEELGSGYIMTDTDMYLAQEKSASMAALLKQRDNAKMGIQNPELRSLSIAALLRCLYASIDSAPNGEYHELAINNLKGNEKVFIMITQLCASTGWIKANIASKYLRVMRYITRVLPTKRLEQEENLIKYEILSIVIKRILGLLKDKIKNVNHNKELTLDDKNILCHLSVICNQLVNQSTLFHQTGKKHEYSKLESLEQRKLRFDIIDSLMSKLFVLDQVEILIDVIFQEMQNATKRLSSNKKEDKFKLRKDLGNNTLENLKRFLTEYLAYCDKNKYHVLQYLMHTMVNDTSKKIRIPFLEEILEGTNQIQMSLSHIRKIIEHDDENFQKWNNDANDDDDDRKNKTKDPFYCLSLCYKKKMDIEIYMEKFNGKLTEEENDQIEKNRNLNDIDCSLGERVLFTQPMPVHVKYATEKNTDEYQVFTVIMTNLGIYIINDSIESSSGQNPADRSKVKAPQRLDRFHYNEIKRVYFAKFARQRIVLCIEREIDMTKIKDTELYDKYVEPKIVSYFGGGAAAATPEATPDETTGGNPDATQDLNASAANMKVVSKKKGRKKQMESIYVTLVVTSINDSMLINQFLDEAKIHCEQSDPNADVLNFYEDLLLEYAMVMRHIHKFVKQSDSKFCPQCKKQRIEEKTQPRKCKCGPDNYVVYAYRIKDFGKGSSTVQRGGQARLLASKHQEGQAKKTAGNMDTEFGVLMVTTQGIYFFTEVPGNWQDLVLDDKHHHLNTDKNLHDILNQKNPKAPCRKFVNYKKEGNSDKPLFIDLKKLLGMSKMQKKVPSLEFRYSISKSDSNSVHFSMMSDFNIEETLFRVKDLKQKSNADDDE